MAALEDYISRIEETCGEEKHLIVFLKYQRKDEAIAKILKKAKIEKSISSIIFDIAFQGIPLRVYANGKILAKKIKNKDAVLKVLSELLL